MKLKTPKTAIRKMHSNINTDVCSEAAVPRKAGVDVGQQDHNGSYKIRNIFKPGARPKQADYSRSPMSSTADQCHPWS